jgi:hypothetical protein
VLKGVHPGISEDDLVVLWGGGTWDWFDPLSVLEAFARVVELIPNAKLYFLGLQLRSDDVAHMKMADLAVERAEQLGLAGKSVFFGDWAPYDLREAYLLEADVAVSAARDLAETRLAFRSRILDYLWAGVPVVATSGDVLSDIVHEERAGVVVPPGDVAAMTNALVTLLGDPVRRATCGARAREVAARFTWDKTVEPLHDVVLRPWRWRAGRQGSSRGRALTEDAQMLVEWRDREIATLRTALEDTQTEASTSAVKIRDLEGIVAHKDRPYAALRRTPIYTVVSWWRRRRRV